MNVQQKLSNPNFYLGKVCKHGHDHTGLAESVRTKNNGTCITCQNIRTSNWMKKNSEKVNAQKKIRRADSENTRDSEYRKENSEKIKLYNKKYIEEHKEWHTIYYREYNSKRRAARLNATPGWADKDKISEFFKEAERLNKETNEVHQVDHIVPLISRLVCGLHVENNLQVLPRTLNIQKGNRWWPDGPFQVIN